MKTEIQTHPDLKRLAEVIAGIPLAMMTTLDDDGVPVSRPMTALEMDAQGTLWFFTDLRSTKMRPLRAVNLAFSDPGAVEVFSGRCRMSPAHRRGRCAGAIGAGLITVLAQGLFRGKRPRWPLLPRPFIHSGDSAAAARGTAERASLAQAAAARSKARAPGGR